MTVALTVAVPVPVGPHAHAAAPVRPAAPAQPEPDVLDVPGGLHEQLGDVVVVERVDDPPAAALADHEAQVAQDAQLVGDGRALHPDRPGEVADRGRPGVQPREDPQTAGRGQRLQALGRGPGVPRVPGEPREVGRPVRHGPDYT